MGTLNPVVYEIIVQVMIDNKLTPALVTTQILSTVITYHNSHYFNKIIKA